MRGVEHRIDGELPLILERVEPTHVQGLHQAKHSGRCAGHKPRIPPCQLRHSTVQQIEGGIIIEQREPSADKRRRFLHRHHQKFDASLHAQMPKQIWQLQPGAPKPVQIDILRVGRVLLQIVQLQAAQFI